MSPEAKAMLKEAHRIAVGMQGGTPGEDTVELITAMAVLEHSAAIREQTQVARATVALATKTLELSQHALDLAAQVPS